MPAGVDDEDGSRLKPGSPIGEYEIAELLGQGGFGTVYRAIHPVIGKSAAIKVLKRELSANPEVVTRFISEMRARSTRSGTRTSSTSSASESSTTAGSTS